ncbi:MAG: integrase, partial [Pseudopedobacter saltans]
MEHTKRSTYKLLFYLKKSAPKKNGKVAVMGRITIDGKVSQFSTKLEINSDNWDLKSGRVPGKSEEARTINQKLDKLRLSIEQNYEDILHVEGFVTSEKLKNTFLGVGVMDNSLLKAYSVYMQENEKAVQSGTMVSGTAAKYLTVYNALKDFLKEKYLRNDIAFRELTSDFIQEFDNY